MSTLSCGGINWCKLTSGSGEVELGVILVKFIDQFDQFDQFVELAHSKYRDV